MKKCINGHLYDELKYDKCPYCELGVDDYIFSDDTFIMTESIDDIDTDTVAFVDNEETISFYNDVHMDESYVTGWLVCVEGRAKGRDYRLHFGFNRIGRSYQMDISLPDDITITRDNHCSIVYEPKDNMFLLVPSQGNLVYLNGKLVLEATLLNTYDSVQIGSHSLTFIAFCKGEVKW